MPLPKLLIGLLLALASCKPTLYVYSETPGMESVIEGAGEPLDIRVRVAEEPGSGVLTLEFRDQHGKVCGRALERVVRADGISDALKNGVIDCTPKAWSCDGRNADTYVAHELGHVAGLLDHVEEEGNLMRATPGTGEVELNDKQKLQLKTVLTAFNEACR